MGFSTRTGTSRLWKPTALRAPVLVVTILLCWALIAVLQYFLTRSQREQGVIFAPKISELPLSHTFLYLYFPTILAVTFSIYWTWIDLETKRMEPYYQLSKENGALGKDSLLLAYPFDFIPLVPIKALKDRYVALLMETRLQRTARSRAYDTATVQAMLATPLFKS